jgi:hypothetical protein
MSMVAKILIVLNLILAVAVMGAAGAYLQSAENWKKNYDDSKSAFDNYKKDAEDRYQKLSATNDENKRSRDAAVTEKTAFEAQAKTLSENNALLQKKLSDYINTLTSMEARLKDLQQNLDNARQSGERLAAERRTADEERQKALEAQNNAETEQKRLQNELEKTGAMLAEAQKNGVAMAENLDKASAELAMYREKHGPLGTVAAVVNGQILAADPSLDLYLISVGSKDGVKVSDVLTVYRGDKFVAQVVVDKVFEDKASVYVQRLDGSPMKTGDIKQGDKVRTMFL